MLRRSSCARQTMIMTPAQIEADRPGGRIYLVKCGGHRQEAGGNGTATSREESHQMPRWRTEETERTRGDGWPGRCAPRGIRCRGYTHESLLRDWNQQPTRDAHVQLQATHARGAFIDELAGAARSNQHIACYHTRGAKRVATP
jgi:hypothetical protein